MTDFELILSISSITAAGAGLWYVQRLVRSSGRDRLRNPEAVQRLVNETIQSEVRSTSKKR
jgi:hypothetical protein